MNNKKRPTICARKEEKIYSTVSNISMDDNADPTYTDMYRNMIRKRSLLLVFDAIIKISCIKTFTFIDATNMSLDDHGLILLCLLFFQCSEIRFDSWRIER